ncbi:MAG: ATP phosphoribosyltransferase regulatory subunit [Alphaproteobacteria bacterium]
MLALRADMTGQLVRIAGGALKDAPRRPAPVLCGQTLRTTPEPLRTRRQHTQVGNRAFRRREAGIDRRGARHRLPCTRRRGRDRLTIDLHYPSVLAALLDEQPKASHATLREAVRLKDTAALRNAGATRIADLLDIAGEAQGTLERLRALKIPAVDDAVSGNRTALRRAGEAKSRGLGDRRPAGALRLRLLSRHRLRAVLERPGNRAGARAAATARPPARTRWASPSTSTR